MEMQVLFWYPIQEGEFMYKIFNPKEAVQGNAKENIFIVMKDQAYIGHGYVYPKVTTITPHHPLNIFMDIELPEQYLYNDIGCELFDKLKKRALTLKQEYDFSNALLYYGAESSNELMDFLIGHGCNERLFSVQLSSDKPLQSKLNMVDVSIEEQIVSWEDMIELHNKYLIRPLTKEVLQGLSHRPHFYCVNLYKEKLIGSLVAYEREGKAYISHIVIDETFLGKGYGYELMAKTSTFFQRHFIQEMILEVWSANEHACGFYETLGFEYKKDTEVYVGMII